MQLCFSLPIAAKYKFIMAFFILTILFSCRKEKAFSDSETSSTDISSVVSRSGDDNYALTSTEIQVWNGMYYFPSYEVLENTLTSLESLNENKEVEAASITALGFLERQDEGVPDEPALEVFNRRFIVKTLRQQMEDIGKLEDSGVVGNEEIDKVLIWDAVLGSIVNQQNEVRIGNLIYKYVDDNKTLVFRADPNLLQLVRTSPDIYNLPERFNLFMIDARKSEDLYLYDKIEAANRNGGCEFGVTWSNDSNHFYFHSYGYFPTGEQVTWKIIDGNGGTIYSIVGSQTFDYVLPTGTTYPVSVSIESSGCTPFVQVFAQNPPPNTYNCDNLTFDYEFIGNSQRWVKFKIPSNTPALNWDFDNDGDIDATSDPCGSAGVSISYLYPKGNDELFTACAYVNTGLCNKMVCKEIGYIGCGTLQNEKNNIDYEVAAPDDRYYSIKFQLKNPLFSKSRISAKLKHYKHGLFFYKKEDADFLGIYLDAFDSNGITTLGDLRYFSSAANGGCNQHDEIALKEDTNVSKISCSRKLTKNASIRASDGWIELTITESIDTTPFPPGFVTSPFTITPAPRIPLKD